MKPNLSSVLQLQVVTFGAAISACEKSSRWPSALQTFEEVESWRDTPVKRNVILCNATMSSAGKGRAFGEQSVLWWRVESCVETLCVFRLLITAKSMCFF